MYIVEGNIGAGKSTFLRLLSEHIPSLEVVFEPLHNWQGQAYGRSLLEHFYTNPQRWAYTIETLTLLCRFQEHRTQQQHNQKLRIMERSVYSGHYCFAKNSFKNGFLSPLEWSLYNAWFNFLVPQHCSPPSGFIYLRVKPQVAYARIQKRKRNDEKQILPSYIEQIHECHEQFLIDKQAIMPALHDVPVLILECDEEFEHNFNNLEKHISKIKQFMQLA